MLLSGLGNVSRLLVCRLGQPGNPTCLLPKHRHGKQAGQVRKNERALSPEIKGRPVWMWTLNHCISLGVYFVWIWPEAPRAPQGPTEDCRLIIYFVYFHRFRFESLLNFVSPSQVQVLFFLVSRFLFLFVASVCISVPKVVVILISRCVFESNLFLFCRDILFSGAH